MAFRTVSCISYIASGAQTADIYLETSANEVSFLLKHARRKRASETRARTLNDTTEGTSLLAAPEKRLVAVSEASFDNLLH